MAMKAELDPPRASSRPRQFPSPGPMGSIFFMATAGCYSFYDTFACYFCCGRISNVVNSVFYVPRHFRFMGSQRGAEWLHGRVLD